MEAVHNASHYYHQSVCNSAEPGGGSVLAEPVTERTIKHDTTKVAQPKQQSLLQLKVRLLPTIIRGTESGVNEIITPAQQAEPNYEQMGAVLLSLESILQELMLKFQKPDKCANKDMTIFKHSTCVGPFEVGGFGFGAGGVGGGTALAAPSSGGGGLLIIIGGGGGAPPPVGGTSCTVGSGSFA